MEEKQKLGDWNMTNAVRLWRGQKAEIGGLKRGNPVFVLSPFVHSFLTTFLTIRGQLYS